MKLVIMILSTLLVGFFAADTDECLRSVIESCSHGGNPPPINCNSQIGHFNLIEGRLRDYTYDQLASSYDYLVLSTHFSSHETSRPGFANIFRELSDKAFDNSIKLIKQVTHRGGVFDFQGLPNDMRSEKKLELDELHALAKALDIEKKLFQQVIAYHAEVSTHKNYDPAITRFLEEEFLNDQTRTIRKLSGHINDLHKIMSSSGGDTSLGVHLFDEYLQKL